MNGGEPSVSFGDDDEKNGVYTFSFEFNNLTGVEHSYALDAVVLTDQFHEGFYEMVGIKLMGESSRVLDAVYSFSNDTDVITVPANGTVSVEVTIELTEEDMAYMDENYPNGIYVEGFVRAYALDEGACDLSLPFLGFYGDWSDARVFDTYSWYHEGMELPERYASILWSDSTNGIAAGGNPYEASLLRFDPDYEGEYYDHS